MSSEQTLELPGFRNCTLPFSAAKLWILIGHRNVETAPRSPATTWKRKPNMTWPNNSYEVHEPAATLKSVEVLSMVQTQNDTALTSTFGNFPGKWCMVSEHLDHGNWAF